MARPSSSQGWTGLSFNVYRINFYDLIRLNFLVFFWAKCKGVFSFLFICFFLASAESDRKRNGFDFDPFFIDLKIKSIRLVFLFVFLFFCLIRSAFGFSFFLLFWNLPKKNKKKRKENNPKPEPPVYVSVNMKKEKKKQKKKQNKNQTWTFFSFVCLFFLKRIDGGHLFWNFIRVRFSFSFLFLNKIFMSRR